MGGTKCAPPKGIVTRASIKAHMGPRPLVRDILKACNMDNMWSCIPARLDCAGAHANAASLGWAQARAESDLAGIHG